MNSKVKLPKTNTKNLRIILKRKKSACEIWKWKLKVEKILHRAANNAVEK